MDELKLGLPYNQGRVSRLLALLGLGFSAFVGCIMLVVGIAMLNTVIEGDPDYQPEGRGRYVVRYIYTTSAASEGLPFLVNVVITLCTECIGFIHARTLTWTLANEHRLEFNQNLRLFSSSKRRFSSNGTLINIIMTFLLILSFAGSNILFLPFNIGASDLDIHPPSVVYLPAFVLLGVVLLLQSAIVLMGLRSTSVTTWSNNPFDVASALVFMGMLEHKEGRCLRSVGSPDHLSGPMHPQPVQVSAWRAHGSVRKVVALTWFLVLATLVLFIGMFITRRDDMPAFRWTFTHAGLESETVLVIVSENAAAQFFAAVILVGTLQSFLTIGLHCCELIVNITRDEVTWRKASSKKGLELRENGLKKVVSNPQSLVLLAAKPVLHWAFGQAVAIQWSGVASVTFFVSQVLNLSVLATIFAIFITFIAFRRPRGHQPATYGHIPTLVNAVDEWPSKKMFWGHKGYYRGDAQCKIYHAGTSSNPLCAVLQNDRLGYM